MAGSVGMHLSAGEPQRMYIGWLGQSVSMHLQVSLRGCILDGWVSQHTSAGELRADDITIGWLGNPILL